MQEKNKKNAGISERILQIIENENINRNVFAQKLGYLRSQTVYDIINGKCMPSYEFFLKFIHSEFSEKYCIKWLISGEGEMLKDIPSVSLGAEAERDESELISKLRKQIEGLERELEMQRGFIETQKKLIEMLEKQSERKIF